MIYLYYYFKKNQEILLITFDKIFNSLLKKKIIVIGVYRHGLLNEKNKNENTQNNSHKDSSFYFVVTAPEENFKVNIKDKLFVISPEYPKPELLNKDFTEDYFEKNEDNEFKENLRVKTRKITVNEMKKEIDEEAENKLINFNKSLENTKVLIDDIEKSFNKISEQSHKYIKNSIKKKLYGIKNQKIE